MKIGIKFFSVFFVLFLFTLTIPSSHSQSEIPEWVKNNAGWWSNGDIPDSAFVDGIQFLIKEGIMKIPPTNQGTSSSENGIPEWIKNNAGWWSNGDIPDSAFVDGIQFLIKEGIMSIGETTSGETTSGETKDYTILVYMVGNNLERNPNPKEVDLLGTLDISEMVAGQPSDSLNIILATGGSEQATPKEDAKRKIDFEKIRYLQVTKKGVQEIKEVGETSMGKDTSLSEFIKWATKNFPAEKYALIFWGHGHATDGFGDDNVHRPDKLKLKELKSGLEKATERSKVNFELIGFDSCLMATIEVADIVSDYGNYMVASEELEVGFGWDYETIIKNLNQNPKQNGAEIGKVIVDSFMEDVENLSSKDDSNVHLFSTLSVVDLKKIGSLKESISQLGNEIEGFNDKEVSDLQQALNKAERYGQRGGKDSGQIDIRGFSKIVGEKLPAYKDTTDTIISNLDSSIVYSKAGKSHPNSHGLSFKFERTGQVDSTDYDFGPTRGMVGFYSTHLDQDKISPELQDLNFQNNMITGTFTGDDIYEINFYFTDEIDDEGILEIFSSVEYDAEDFPDRNIEFAWEGKEPSLCNSKFCYPINPEWEWGESNDMAYLPVIVYTELNKNGLRGDLIYDITDKPNPTFIGFWPVGDNETVFQKNILPLLEGDIVQIIATLEHWESGSDYYEPAERLEVDSEFGFSWKVYDWGLLDVWIEICDFSDNCDWSEKPFQINPLDVAVVDIKDIIPRIQNDPLNQDYEWVGDYELEFAYDYDDYEYDEYDEDYEYDYGEYYDEYYDEYYEFEYLDEVEECWYDDEDYVVCEFGGCGLDYEGYEVCHGEYYG